MENKKYTLVFNTDKGGVYKETARELYQVEFGNIMLLFTYENLLSFSHFIASADEERIQKLKTGPSNKIAIYPGQFVGCYAFTEKEFWEFKDLMEGAISMLKMEMELVEIFNNE